MWGSRPLLNFKKRVRVLTRLSATVVSMFGLPCCNWQSAVDERHTAVESATGQKRHVTTSPRVGSTLPVKVYSGRLRVP